MRSCRAEIIVLSTIVSDGPGPRATGLLIAIAEYVLVQREVVGTDDLKSRGKRRKNFTRLYTSENCLVEVLGRWKFETARGDSVAVPLFGSALT